MRNKRITGVEETILSGEERPKENERVNKKVCAREKRIIFDIKKKKLEISQ